MKNYSHIFKDSVSFITVIFLCLVPTGFAQANTLIAQGLAPQGNVKESVEKAAEPEKSVQDTDKSSDETATDSENHEDEEDFEFEPDDSNPDDSNAVEEPGVTKESEATDPIQIMDLEREAKEAFSNEPYRFLSFFLSPGSEKLHAHGGSSNYSGNSQFLGLDLSLRIEPPSWKGFSLLFSTHFHEFVTTNFVRVRSEANASSTDSLRFQRSNLGMNLQKEVFIFEAIHQFFLSIGVLTSQLPILETSSVSTGATQLDSFYYTGVMVGGAYEFIWSERGRMVLSGLYLVRSFNSLKSIERTLLTLGNKYLLMERLFLRTNIRWVKETAEYNLHCPDDQQVACSSKGKLESQLSYGQLGIGFEF